MRQPQDNIVLGIIGGSGVYKLKDINIIKKHYIRTPFGKPSSPICEAAVCNNKMFFLARHGLTHSLLPSEINYRANIYALKKLGVNTIVAISAVGIMQPDIYPSDIIIPDQLFDYTKGFRASTFFGNGCVAHVEFGEPFCSDLRKIVIRCAQKHASNVVSNGTLVIIEGPQYSTLAESNFFRSTLNPVAIGMTALPEAKLAKEAGICYALVAMATDYDCWHKTKEKVNAKMVAQIMNKNFNIVSNIIKDISHILCQSKKQCHCADILQHALLTPYESIPLSTKKKLKYILNHI